MKGLAFFVLVALSPANAEPKCGNAIIESINLIPPRERDTYLLLQMSDPVPNRSLQFCRISWDAPAADGQTSHSIAMHVSTDYLAVGTTDPIRVPMSPVPARQLADELDCILPTTLMVDQIHSLARFKLQPQPFSPDLYDIESPTLWQLHNDAINAQIDKAGAPAGALVSGIKKDIVITNRLTEQHSTPRVAIYGWHQSDGTPIQPLSLVHKAEYVDYSHGIRLVKDSMQLDGQTTSAKAILLNPKFAHLLSREGPMTSATISY